MKAQVFALCALAATSSSFANENGEEKDFTMDGELGVILTTGNTESSSLKAKLNSHHELENWSNDYVVEGFYKQESIETDGDSVDTTSAQKFFASGQANYKLNNPKHRLFAFTSYEDDRFSGYDYQATIAGGWSQQMWSDKISSFNYSIGPGYSFAEKEDGSDVSGFIVRGAVEYKRKISDTANFRQSLSTEVGNENTKSKSETSLSVRINGSLQMKLSVLLNHNTDVDPGIKSLDSETAVTLVYSFF